MMTRNKCMIVFVAGAAAVGFLNTSYGGIAPIGLLTDERSLHSFVSASFCPDPPAALSLSANDFGPFTPFDHELPVAQRCENGSVFSLSHQNSTVSPTSFLAVGGVQSELSAMAPGTGHSLPNSRFKVTFENPVEQTFAIEAELEAVGHIAPPLLVLDVSLSLTDAEGLEYLFAMTDLSSGESDLVTIDETIKLPPGIYTIDLVARSIVDGMAMSDLTGVATYAFNLAPADVEEIPGDLNGDGLVDVFDLLILLGDWGQCADPAECPADLNDDGVVDVFDLLILLSNWS